MSKRERESYLGLLHDSSFSGGVDRRGSFAHLCGTVDGQSLTVDILDFTVARLEPRCVNEKHRGVEIKVVCRFVCSS